jgi:hypothetical protein
MMLRALGVVSDICDHALETANPSPAGKLYGCQPTPSMLPRAPLAYMRSRKSSGFMCPASESPRAPYGDKPAEITVAFRSTPLIAA